ncbi:zinc ribbon domain-containing protein [Rubinisphaera italica]|uniref:zinc ribbon domain-containing protein n=1 Tax=Rubinisphaera italica TaxID=2527969 RepID=UPI0011B7E0D8|nr:zinc ribbon domain-containing protein [Rubinisphaera italica]
MIALLDERNAKFARNGSNGRDTRKNVSKKRTRFPGQMIVCGICGRKYVFGGHGQKDHLMCDGARSHVCWNGASVDGPLTAEKIMAAVFQAVEALPDFDDTFMAEVRQEIENIESRVPDERIRCQQQIEKLERELDNLVNFIREGNSSETVQREIPRIESELKDQRKCLKRLQKPAPVNLSIPSIEELKSLAIGCLKEHAIESWEFRTLIQKLIPKIAVYPHQLFDGGGFVLRARFRLRLGDLLESTIAQQALSEPLEQRLQVDLFNPPQREAFRRQIVDLRNRSGDERKLTEKEIAGQLGLTVAATQRAAALQRSMDNIGIEDPYQPLTEPPAEGKLKRHLHPRYRFEPLPTAGEY